MASRFSIETEFRAVDKFTKPLERLNRKVSNFAANTRRKLGAASRALSGFGGAFRTALGVAGIAGGLFLFQAAMVDTIQTGVKFEQTLVNAAAKFPEGARRGTAAFKILEDTARSVGATTEFTASQAAEGLNFLAMAGFNARQSIAALPGVVDLATASQTDLAAASDIATDSLGAFGLTSKDATALAENLTRVNDAMAKTSVTANTDMLTMFETIKAGAADATGAGASMETFLALTGQLANKGKKGSEAGTALKNMFLKLAAPEAQAARLLGQLGVKVADSNGDMRDMFDILQDLEGGLKGFGTQEKSAALDLIFGKRAISAVNILLGVGSNELRAYRKQLEAAAGASKEMAAVMRDTVQGRINTLRSSFEGLQISIFKMQSGPLTDVLETLTKWVRVADQAIQKNPELASSFIDGIGRAGIGLIGIFLELGIVVAFLRVLLLTLQLAMFAVQGATMLVSAALALWTGVVWLANAALVVTRFTVLTLWLAFSINPIGLIIGLFALLVAGGVLLWKNWDTIKDRAGALWDSLKSKFTSGVEAVKNIVAPLKDILSAPFELFSEGFGKLQGLLGFGEGEGEGGAAGAQPGVVTPGERVARSIEESTTTTRSEVRISDETGRASFVGPPAPGVRLAVASSGGMD